MLFNTDCMEIIKVKLKLYDGGLCLNITKPSLARKQLFFLFWPQNK